jgi:hypothetical protein
MEFLSVPSLFDALFHVVAYGSMEVVQSLICHQRISSRGPVTLVIPEFKDSRRRRHRLDHFGIFFIYFRFSNEESFVRFSSCLLQFVQWGVFLIFFLEMRDFWNFKVETLVTLALDDPADQRAFISSQSARMGTRQLDTLSDQFTQFMSKLLLKIVPYNFLIRHHLANRYIE